MNSRTLSTLAIAGFVLLGSVSAGMRYRARQEAQNAREVTRWELVCQVNFEAVIPPGTQDQAQVGLGLPFDTRHGKVLNRDRVLWITTNSYLQGSVRGPFKYTGNQELQLTTRQAGSYEGDASWTLLIDPQPRTSSQLPLENLTADARNRFLREDPDDPNLLPVNDVVVRQKAQAITADAVSDAERVQLVFMHCTQIDSDQEAASDSVKDALTLGTGTPLARARTMVTLCRSLKIPARLVTGFFIQQGSDVQPLVWVEVFLNQAWVPFDPKFGWSLSLPMEYVPVRRDSDQIVSREANVDKLVAKFAIHRLEPDVSVLQGDVPHPIQILNLLRLPVPMHTVMKILLLLPFAALITAILRNVVGLKTFGTFSPALLAMSFIFADLTTGLAILAIVVAVGLVGRTFLEKLRLLMVPRLSIILTMVILCVVFGLSVLHYLLPSKSAEVVLLPMVIMTMLIERFHVSAEEDGLMFTLQLAVGTLLVAILCYLVLVWESVGELVLTYPEIHFFTIAAFIFLGRYAGYRLTELWRFSDLVNTSETGR
jgi:7 transmembrane helices usually fused to an inactive transglutaminase/Transglutaminase-like superfamily